MTTFTILDSPPNGSEEHIMRHIFRAARNSLVPVAALAIASTLGGCVAYNGYPAGSYSYAYPSSYYGGYSTSYAANYPAYTPYSYPAYSSDYNSTFNTYATSGDGN
jgi:hypothetical protein